jgi:hypothetical protein
VGVTHANIPPARKSQKWSDFLPLLLSILRRTKNADVIYDCEFIVSESVLNLTIMEPMLKGMSLFIKLQLQLSKNQESSMRNLLTLSAGAMARYGEEIKQLDLNNAKLEKIIDRLQSELDKTADEKDSFQNEMMRKMCVLLNYRGNEIRRLRASQKCEETHCELESLEKGYLNHSPEHKSIQGVASSSSLQQDDKLLESNYQCPSGNNIMSSHSLNFLKVPSVVDSAELLKSLSQEISQSQSDIVRPNIRSSSNSNCNDSNDNKSNSSSSSSSSSSRDCNHSNGNKSSSNSNRYDSNGDKINNSSCNLAESSGLINNQNASKNNRFFSANGGNEVVSPKLTDTAVVKPKKRKKLGDDSDTD